MFDCFEEQKALVTELVNIKSVVGCDGCEQAMAEHLHEKLAGWDYFKEHPEDLFLIPTENDTLKRGSVAAVVKGEFGNADAGGDKTRQTVLLMGHIDTVAISDYGKLESLALRPEELRKAFENSADPELAEDAGSGRYMFGRGALDMKAGVASHLFVLRYFSEHRTELKGNLIVLFECDEEGDSHGMLTSVGYVKRLAEERGLAIKAAVCSDYSTEKTVYLGTIGKYLPCFMAFGRSSHVGQVFSSVDPNLVTAELTAAIDYNTAFCEEDLGEKTQPPVSLKLRDTKDSYSVQTAESAYVYFNWFALKKTEEDILSICRYEAEKAARRVAERIQHGAVPPRVFTLKEYAEKLGTGLRDPDPFTDIREFRISEAVRIRRLDQDMSPVILVFMAGISYPPVRVSPDSEIGRAAAELGIPVKTYYPYISDTSFVSLLGGVPSVNLGTFGKDAHMFSERVEMEYSFKDLPNLTWQLLTKLMK